MAPCPHSPRRKPVPQKVVISGGGDPLHYVALIDADCWTPDRRPGDIGGFLDVPRDVRELLASSERLILTLCESAEPYRMIIDGGTGRFVARKL